MSGKISILKMSVFMVAFASLAYAQDQAQFNYDDHGKRDPFWPLVSTTGSIISYETDLSASDLNLEGIITGDNGDNLAIINGNIVKVNGRFGQFTVINITKDTVVLSKNDSRFELKLKKEE